MKEHNGAPARYALLVAVLMGVGSVAAFVAAFLALSQNSNALFAGMIAGIFILGAILVRWGGGVAGKAAIAGDPVQTQTAVAPAAWPVTRLLRVGALMSVCLIVIGAAAIAWWPERKDFNQVAVDSRVELRLVADESGSSAARFPQTDGQPDIDLDRTVALAGKDMTSIRLYFDDTNGQTGLAMSFAGDGPRAQALFTEAHVGRRVAIVDKHGVVVLVSVIAGPIPDGELQISGMGHFQAQSLMSALAAEPE